MQNNEVRFLPAIAHVLTFSALFAWLRYAFSANTLNLLVNSVGAGLGVAFAWALIPLVSGILRGEVKRADVGWYTLGLIYLIGGVALWFFTSISAISTGTNSAAWTSAVAGKYIILCGVGTILYSPDVGQGVFHGRDRKIIAGSLAAGFVVALAVIYIQAYDVFAK